MKNKNNPQIITRLKSYPAVFAFCLMQITNMIGQEQIYDDFEGTKVLYYGERFGVLDTNAKNPAPGGINTSAKCALYVRNGTKKFANIKMNLPKRITAVEAYATYLGIPPKIKMRVYTAAPVGTLVEILLGSKRGNNDYPAGTHSQYQAYTTKTNEWEELEFKFSQIPQGSETAADQIDQIVLLFNPNSSNADTYYFDNLTGPPILSVAVENTENTTKPEKPGKSKVPMTKKTTAEKKNKK